MIIKKPNGLNEQFEIYFPPTVKTQNYSPTDEPLFFSDKKKGRKPTGRQ